MPLGIEKLLEPIRNKIKMILNRAIVQLVNDGLPIQVIQVSLLKDEIKGDIERLNDYGFTSVPRAGSEAIIAFMNGNRDQGIAIKVDDSRVRLKGLEAGEVAVYNFTGSYIKLDKDGNIKISSEKDIIIEKATLIKIGDAGLLPTAGVVTGECLCAFTGLPHPDKSAKVLAEK